MLWFKSGDAIAYRLEIRRPKLLLCLPWPVHRRLTLLGRHVTLATFHLTVWMRIDDTTWSLMWLSSCTKTVYISYLFASLPECWSHWITEQGSMRGFSWDEVQARHKIYCKKADEIYLCNYVHLQCILFYKSSCTLPRCCCRWRSRGICKNP